MMIDHTGLVRWASPLGLLMTLALFRGISAGEPGLTDEYPANCRMPAIADIGEHFFSPLDGGQPRNTRVAEHISPSGGEEVGHRTTDQGR